MLRHFLGGKCEWTKAISDRSRHGYKGLEVRQCVGACSILSQKHRSSKCVHITPAIRLTWVSFFKKVMMPAIHLIPTESISQKLRPRPRYF